MARSGERQEIRSLDSVLKYAWFVLAALGGWFVLEAVDTPAIDGDLDWQRYAGRAILATHRLPRALGVESFTAPGAPWIPHEWLFSTAVAASMGTRAWPWFALSVALCAAFALALTAWRAVRRGAAPLATAAATLFAGIAMCSAFGVRAQVADWAFLALLLLLLDEEGAWMWAAVPVTAVWANLHAGAMLAPVLTGAVALGRVIEDRAWTSRVRRSVVVSAATALAVCCTPFGLGLPLYALGLLASPLKSAIGEWQPGSLETYGYALGALPLLLCAATMGIARGRSAAQDALTFVLFAALLFAAARHTPLFAVAVAPLTARALTRDDEQRQAAPVGMPLLAGWAATGFSFAVVTGLALIFAGSGANAATVGPQAEIAALERIGGEHRVFCEDFAWCAALLGIPGQRVFLDGRADPYPLAVWRAYRVVTTLAPEWSRTLDAYGVNAAIVQCGTPLDQGLALSGRWTEEENDGRFRLWVR